MKEILVSYGLKIVFEDDYNWIFDDPHDSKAEPIPVPKIGDVLAVDVMMDTLLKAKLSFGAYLALKEKVLGTDWHLLPDAETRARKPN